ncbi:hypothetical protein DFJ73DRAFT_959214 [Zopfochytrium polystomum]|nr:hypothetical protein DFJ73DRAFT_959214 [Zopfochytrium polystomum]
MANKQPAAVAVAVPRVDPRFATTAFTLPVELTRSFCKTSSHYPGYQIVENKGIARGLTVRNPNAGKSFVAGFAAMGGGESSVYMEMAEKARATAMERVLASAAALGANAIIGVRYDTQEIMPGMTEVFAYGTAVVVSPSQQP